MLVQITCMKTPFNLFILLFVVNEIESVSDRRVDSKVSVTGHRQNLWVYPYTGFRKYHKQLPRLFSKKYKNYIEKVGQCKKLTLEDPYGPVITFTNLKSGPFFICAKQTQRVAIFFHTIYFSAQANRHTRHCQKNMCRRRKRAKMEENVCPTSVNALGVYSYHQITNIRKFQGLVSYSTQ